MASLDVLKIFIPAAVAFGAGVLGAPALTDFLYAHKMWKKAAGKTALDGTRAVEFEKLRETMHAGTETHTPRMGGILVWATAALVTLGFFALARLMPLPFLVKLDFLTRNQTWIPLVTLLGGAFVGLLNDLLDIRAEGERGIRLRTRILFVAIVALGIGWWFYAKLGMTAIGVPGDGALMLGWLIIPLFMLVSLGLYAGGVIDGIDGLAGGVFASIFLAYAGIAYFQDQINLAAFSATVVGALLAFLWYNIPPARFWMTETGTMGLTMTIAVLAFMTDTPGDGYGVIALPIIAFPLVATVCSDVLQVFWKRILKRRLFRIAPLHHHFEAIGWPSYKVTMRYWIIAIMCALLGMSVALLKLH